jgi:hypothetical protein
MEVATERRLGFPIVHRKFVRAESAVGYPS